ncbi:MAG: hypothetical protein SGJ24_17305 [Chloroflexota bacterium]|nr:hypothetical protein [Chloroflexota bacterium]
MTMQFSTTTTIHQDCTSPWTEPYQTASADAHADQREAQRAFEQECQRPTLDALSDIYNRQ